MIAHYQSHDAVSSQAEDDAFAELNRMLGLMVVQNDKLRKVKTTACSVAVFTR